MNDSILKNLTEDYLSHVQELISAAPPGAGLLGFGSSPKTDACHQQYYDAMEKAVSDLVSSSPGQPEARDAVEFLLTAYDRYEAPGTARLMLIPIQRLSIPLIPFLSAGDRAALCKAYEKSVPRRQRLPVQKQVLKALS